MDEMAAMFVALPAGEHFGAVAALAEAGVRRYAVEKRARAVGKILRGEDFGTIWEYQLMRVIRRIPRPARTARRADAPSRQAIR